MLKKIISGGETGAEQAAWRVALVFGLSTGGWMPRGFFTEDGPRPEFAAKFGAIEIPNNNVTSQNELNVRDADATIWFGETATSVAQSTVGACCSLNKACMPISPQAAFDPVQIANWIKTEDIRILNVAGSRESEEPGIGERVETFFGQVLECLGLTES